MEHPAPYVPGEALVADAVIMAISDEQLVPPETVAGAMTLDDLGFVDAAEILSLSYAIERRLKLSIPLRKRMELILGGDNPDLMRSVTVSGVIRRVHDTLAAVLN